MPITLVLILAGLVLRFATHLHTLGDILIWIGVVGTVLLTAFFTLFTRWAWKRTDKMFDSFDRLGF